MAKRQSSADAEVAEAAAQLGIDTISVDSLVQDPKNARRHTKRNLDTIENSLKEVGAARSIVIDEDNRILAGNATARMAPRAGISRVRIIDVEEDEIIAVRKKGLTEEQKTRLALYDNRSGEFAEWDEAALREAIDEVGGDGMFTREELDKILGDGNTEPEIDDLDMRPPPEMLWCLIGIPLSRFIDVQDTLAKLEEFKEVSVKTTGKPR